MISRAELQNFLFNKNSELNSFLIQSVMNPLVSEVKSL